MTFSVSQISDSTLMLRHNTLTIGMVCNTTPTLYNQKYRQLTSIKKDPLKFELPHIELHETDHEINLFKTNT